MHSGDATPGVSVPGRQSVHCLHQPGEINKCSHRGDCIIFLLRELFLLFITCALVAQKIAVFVYEKNNLHPRVFVSCSFC